MKKKKIAFPHTIIVILAMAVFFALLTWIIPAGVYDTQVLPDGRTGYVPGSYHVIERTGIGPWALMKCITKGFVNNAAIFFMIFIAGGAIFMLEETKALEYFGLSYDPIKIIEREQYWKSVIVTIEVLRKGYFRPLKTIRK